MTTLFNDACGPFSLASGTLAYNQNGRLVGKAFLPMQPLTMSLVLAGIERAFQLSPAATQLSALANTGPSLPALLLATAQMESALLPYFSSPANNPTEAWGYFQIISPVRKSLSQQYGAGFLHPDTLNSVTAACILYGQAASALQRGVTPMVNYGRGALDNYLLNLRSVYGGGMKYRHHPDAIAGIRNFIPIFKEAKRLIAQALSVRATGDVPKVEDLSRLKFMTPQLRGEYGRAPASVKQTIQAIMTKFPGTHFHVTSVNSDYMGRLRGTGNHVGFRAVDIALAPPAHDPMFLKSRLDGTKISPRYPFNPAMLIALADLEAQNKLTARVGIETDHIHVDANGAPGAYVYATSRKGYTNDVGCCAPAPKLTPVTKILDAYYIT